MAATGRNQPCPCGSGRKYKKCCLERDALRAGARRRGHLDLVEDFRDGETVVFDCDFDEGLTLEIKRLPGRRFDWRAGVWLVPAGPGLAGRVRAILAARPWLETSPALGRWLAAERRFLAEVTVVEGSTGASSRSGRSRVSRRPISSARRSSTAAGCCSRSSAPAPRSSRSLRAPSWTHRRARLCRRWWSARRA